ncbi:GIY-YIG nuclease family protein [Amorphus orientalis]|uniref:Endonuclease n=1 Tax=Amorphus orientalis TaxID=649198 RepID=A0AAE3VTL4_9HYPH|nr:GIY-YIG nuclease family protein [Amorphus orientalis]MDQ0317376.1 putative endonuclease [Amorphus orientalis]
MSFAVYLLANRRNGTLYLGMTDNLAQRVYEHREKVRRGFSARYGVSRLVWYEIHDSREAAFTRERQIKTWHRAWKLRLIEEMNPEWDDLYETLQL